MNPLRLAACAASVLLIACSGDDAPASTTPGVSPTSGSSATVPAPDLAESSPRDLIYWDSFFGDFGNPGERREALLEAIGDAAQDDPAYRAFLIDLALYPTPYRDRAWELLDIGEPFSGEAVLALFGDLGPASPADDLDTYVEFKSVLLSTIDPGFAALLNPREDHTISAQEVIWGGVPIDGIPPLNDPAFVSAAEAADWILPTDLVIGVEINGDARAYPRRIIDWHEMVNDTVGGVPVSLAYCTLCGSAILYDGRAGGEVLRFGTSGLLYRSNKLMYDTATRTLWEQYTGEPAWGDMVGSGVRLEVLPSVQVTWADWLADHPNTRVLDIETGFLRDYGPGVAYADYWASPDLRFPAPDDQGPLAVKDIVYTVRLEGEAVAYPIDLLAQRGVIEDEIGGRSVVIVATEDGNGGRAYERGEVSFTSVNFDTGTLSSADGDLWRISEEVLVGADGTVLQRLPGHNSFWFAFVNHAPLWRLYQE
jgi:Protein of unknown function (DUF3179)